jgi:DNA-binding PadR family transcriptional regulator
MKPEIRLTYPRVKIAKEFVKNPHRDYFAKDLIAVARSEPGTVYPILRRFEDLGLIRCERGAASSHKGPPSNVYKVTEDGLRVFIELLARWDSRK